MRSLGLLTFMLPVGFSQASQILVGNAVGGGKAKLAMQYYRVCLCIAIVVTGIQIALLAFFMDETIAVYTSMNAIEQ